MDASIHRVDERASLLRGAVQRAGERRRRPGEQAFAFEEELRRRGAGESTGPGRGPGPENAIAGPEPVPDPSASAFSACDGEAGANLDLIV